MDPAQLLIWYQLDHIRFTCQETVCEAAVKEMHVFNVKLVCNGVSVAGLALRKASAQLDKEAPV
jgi:hypothetical protein